MRIGFSQRDPAIESKEPAAAEKRLAASKGSRLHRRSKPLTVATERNLAAAGALVGIAALWGLSFPTMKAALVYVTPFELLALRNVVGLVALAILWGPSILRQGGDKKQVSDPYTAKAGALLGSMLVAGLALQVVGLQTTTSVKAGFLSGLYVIFTPFVAIPFVHTVPSKAVVGSAVAALVGIFLLTVGDLRSFGSVAPGDILNVGAALGFALHVAFTGKYAPRCDFRRLCLIQASVKAICFSPALLRVDPKALFVGRVAVAVLVTGLGATALGLAVQTWAQRKVSAPATAVILSSEPAFAGMFGFLILGESLSLSGLIGAGILFAAILVAARYSREGMISTPT